MHSAVVDPLELAILTLAHDGFLPCIIAVELMLAFPTASDSKANSPAKAVVVKHPIQAGIDRPLIRHLANRLWIGFAGQFNTGYVQLFKMGDKVRSSGAGVDHPVYMNQDARWVDEVRPAVCQAAHVQHSVCLGYRPIGIGQNRDIGPVLFGEGSIRLQRIHAQHE